MRVKFILCAALVGLLSACSTPGPKSKMGPICLSVKGLPEQEEGVLLRRTIETLAKAGFTHASTGCDGTLVYERLAATQGSQITTIGNVSTTSRTWNEEGITSLVRAAKLVYQDKHIHLEGYSTKQHLLEDLAKAMIKPLAQQFEGTASN